MTSEVVNLPTGNNLVEVLKAYDLTKSFFSADPCCSAPQVTFIKWGLNHKESFFKA